MASVALASMLAYAGTSKLVSLPASGNAIGGLLQLGSARASRHVALLLAVVEIALGLDLVLQVTGAAVLVAVCLTALLGVQCRTLRARGSGVPCGCYGPRSVVSGRSALRLGAWTVAAWALAGAAPDRVDPALMGWSVAVVIGAALVVAVGVARELARSAAALTEDTGADGALEIESEGPVLGATLDLPQTSTDAALHLAVFLSPACGMCRRLQPAIEVFASRPDLRLRVYDEERDAEVWRDADVPGSPYAVACDGSGRVLAKGAFNTMRQLESVCATAVRRSEYVGEDVRAA